MRGFTHLHTASGFSLRYGASHPDALAERAAARGLDALALTDRDTLGGAVRFAKAASRAGIRPLFGVDLAVAAPVEAAERTERRRAPARGGAFVDESAQRVAFLARDGADGWAELSPARHRGAPGCHRRLRAGPPPAAALGRARRRGRGARFRTARPRLGRRPRARRRSPGPRGPAARALAGAVRERGTAHRGRLPRPERHRTRLPAARRPRPRIRRGPGDRPRTQQRRPLRRRRTGAGRGRP